MKNGVNHLPNDIRAVFVDGENIAWLANSINLHRLHVYFNAEVTLFYTEKCQVTREISANGSDVVSQLVENDGMGKKNLLDRAIIKRIREIPDNTCGLLIIASCDGDYYEPLEVLRGRCPNLEIAIIGIPGHVSRQFELQFSIYDATQLFERAPFRLTPQLYSRIPKSSRRHKKRCEHKNHKQRSRISVRRDVWQKDYMKRISTRVRWACSGSRISLDELEEEQFTC